MPQRMRADAHARAAGRDVAAHQPVDAADGQTSAAIVQEERAAGAGWAGPAGRSVLPFQPFPPFLPTKDLLAILQIFPNRRRRARIERHDARLASLAEDANHPCAHVDVVDIDAYELAEPQAGRVEQLEDGAVAPAEWRVAGRRGDERRHVRLRQMRRDAYLALGRRDKGRWIIVH